MWCGINVMFMMLDDFQKFITGDFGDMEVDNNNMSVMCYGNYRLLNDVHSWCESVSQGKVITEENFDGYDTTTTYEDGVMLSQESVEEERDA